MSKQFIAGVKAARKIVDAKRFEMKEWREKYLKQGEKFIAGRFSFVKMKFDEALAEIDLLTRSKT